MTTKPGDLVRPCWNKRAFEGRAYLAKNVCTVLSVANPASIRVRNPNGDAFAISSWVRVAK